MSDLREYWAILFLVATTMFSLGFLASIAWQEPPLSTCCEICQMLELPR